MILVTKSKKKVVGLDGYGIKITKQEIIKWLKKEKY
jgi:3,4-dihydroxy 2-butanone 4-phosphate synthase/GTP cyclohydrolase II